MGPIQVYHPLQNEIDFGQNPFAFYWSVQWDCKFIAPLSKHIFCIDQTFQDRENP